MFRIVEQVGDEPMRFPAKPRVWFEPGMVVKLIQFQGDLVADACDGYDAMGLVGNEMYLDADKPVLDPKFMVEIWSQRMVFRTNKYDLCAPMETADPLYSGWDGFLTTKRPFEGATMLGRIITPPLADRSYFEALFL